MWWCLGKSPAGWGVTPTLTRCWCSDGHPSTPSISRDNQRWGRWVTVHDSNKYLLTENWNLICFSPKTLFLDQNNLLVNSCIYFVAAPSKTLLNLFLLNWYFLIEICFYLTFLIDLVTRVKSEVVLNELKFNGSVNPNMSEHQQVAFEANDK